MLSRRVVVEDGVMGTQLQAADLSLDDFKDLEGCGEILCETLPDVIEQIHRNCLAAGSDAVETKHVRPLAQRHRGRQAVGSIAATSCASQTSIRLTT